MPEQDIAIYLDEVAPIGTGTGRSGTTIIGIENPLGQEEAVYILRQHEDGRGDQQQNNRVHGRPWFLTPAQIMASMPQATPILSEGKKASNKVVEENTNKLYFLFIKIKCFKQIFS